MKTNLVVKGAVALIIASTTATAFAEATPYGRFRGHVICTDTGADNDDCQMQNGSSRFGFKVNHDLGNGMKAFGKYEFAVNLDKGQITTGNTNRLAYVGIKSGMNEFSIGARWNPFYSHVYSPIDPTNMVGGTSSSFGYNSPFRTSDTINFKTQAGKAKIGVQVQMDSDVDGDQADRISLGATIPLGSMSLGLGYDSSADEGTADGETRVGLNVNGNFGGFTAGVSFVTLDVAESDHLLLAVGTSLGQGASINASYGQNSLADDSTPTSIGVEYAKKLSKSFRWYAGVDSSDADTSADAVTRYGAGMRLDW